MKTGWQTGKRLAVVLVCLVLLPVAWLGAKLVTTPHAGHWWWPYLSDVVRGHDGADTPTTDMIFIFCDHWEPGGGDAGLAKARDWLARYEPIADRYRDSQGRRFQYTWFYPIDNFQPAILDLLSGAVGRGYGEVEVHWHHHHRSEEAFRRDLAAAIQRFTAAGALVSEPGGSPHWCFIHGNWALDGSVPRRCGITNELDILQEFGCYADLTFPALGTSAQPATINRIYYAVDDPGPRSYDHGTPARAGRPGHGLLMLPGPLGINFRDPVVLIEYGALDDARGTGLSGRILRPRTPAAYFAPSRVPFWDRVHVGVAGRPEWCFVKIHAHGIQHRRLLLGGELAAMLEAVTAYCRERGIRLHFVTAREACNLVWAAEKGLTGDPTPYYDLVIPPPLNRTAGAAAGAGTGHP